MEHVSARKRLSRINIRRSWAETGKGKRKDTETFQTEPIANNQLDIALFCDHTCAILSSGVIICDLANCDQCSFWVVPSTTRAAQDQLANLVSDLPATVPGANVYNVISITTSFLLFRATPKKCQPTAGYHGELFSGVNNRLERAEVYLPSTIKRATNTSVWVNDSVRDCAKDLRGWAVVDYSHFGTNWTNTDNTFGNGPVAIIPAADPSRYARLSVSADHPWQPLATGWVNTVR